MMNAQDSAIPDAQLDWTTREIAQQPDAWRQAVDAVRQQREALDGWLKPVLAEEGLRIILTGAGSSAYIGEALAPALTKALRRPVDAISTTSLVAAPDAYLITDRPTLLISFARSGSSPESLGAVQIASDFVTHCHHLIICCNPDSALGRFEGGTSTYRIFMPPQTLDQSFAMTSSLTSMLVTVLAAFAWDEAQLDGMIAAGRRLLAVPTDDIRQLIEDGFARGVFLGSGALQGIATEAALKMLEMNAGDYDCYAESPLGFRHGPKFVVDRDTLVVVLTHPSPYTRQYDEDLLSELDRDGVARNVVALHEHPALSGAALDDAHIGPVYLIWCQRLAYLAARHNGHSPDNPSPSGRVNRVVQGVTLYPFAP